MILLYIIALIPISIGGVLWIFNKKIDWKEWVIGSILALFIAGIFNIISLFSNEMVDIETWNGQVTQTIFYPKWVEKYQVAVYKTVTRTGTRYVNGKSETYTYTEQVFSHYEDRYRTHNKYWEIKTNIDSGRSVSEQHYKQIGKIFGGNQKQKRVSKSGFYSGDPNIYWYDNETKVVIPYSINKTWQNNLKAGTSVYTFAEVPEEMKSKIYEWPKITNWNQSNRLLGSGYNISIEQWDVLNASIGKIKQCNLILIGFSSEYDSSIAELQRSYWMGGKKNDIVMCVGLNNGKVAWSKTFGWAQNEIVFANLDTILLSNTIDNSIIPLIKEEVIKNYKRKEWADFNYIKVQPPTWVFIAYPIIILLTQAGFYVWSHKN